MSRQLEYRRFCGEVGNLSLMMTSTWMDVICGEGGWDVALLEDEDGIIAAIPFQIKKKLQVSKLRTPPFTCDSGPWFRPFRKETLHGKISEYHNAVEGLIKAMPNSDFMEFKLNVNTEDVQPWLWEGFEALPMYTYTLDVDKEWDDIISGFNRTVRKEVNREDLGFMLDVEHDEVLPFMEKHHDYWSEELSETISKLMAHDELVVQAIAHSNGGNEQSMLIYVEDGETLHLLTSAVDRECEDKMTFYKLLILLMEEMQGSIRKIDFMGSMDKQISHNFRAMGASPQLYFRVKKANRSWMNWAK